MTLDQVMKELERCGTAQARKIYARHGAREPMFGVSYADFGKLVKRIGQDHELALALFDTGNHDARILATMIVDPDALRSRDIDRWMRACDSYPITDAVSGVVARTKHARKKADAWRKAKDEWKSAAGWNLVSFMAAPGGETEDGWLAGRLDEIEQGIGGAPNRTRHSMNQALIAIGGYRPGLRKLAVATAKRVGRVEVDHGQTSCKTPEAIPYIHKMAKRYDGKTKPGPRKTPRPR